MPYKLIKYQIKNECQTLGERRKDKNITYTQITYINKQCFISPANAVV